MTSRRAVLFAIGLLSSGHVGAAPAPPADTLADAQHSYDTGDFQSARRIWQALAESGDADAAYHMGLLYDLGQGVPASADEAFKWYLRAAEEQSPAAEFNVAVSYDGGRGTPHDAKVAATWYGRAAAHGMARAAYDLAQLYAAGEGVPQNPDAAVAWFRAASSQVPAAAEHLAALGRQRRAALSAASEAATPPGLASPLPVSAAALPEPAATAAGRTLELVWTAPAQPVPVRYLVSVVGLRDAAWISVFRHTTELSSQLVTPIAGIDCYAWRIYSVGIGVPHYAASPWQRIGCTPSG